MRKIFTLVIALLTVAATSAQTDSTTVTAESSNTSSVWENANKAYAEGQFQVAELLYTQMVEEGYRDAAIFYNLGNACFQQNQIGKAILNFKRATLADPSDKDIEYNLELAKSKTKDKIDTVPTFFLTEWLIGIRNILSPDGWAKLSLISLILALGFILLWLLGSPLSLRKTGFYSCIVLSLLFVISVANGLSAASAMYSSNEAIVISSAAIIKSSPSESGKDLCIIHEGTSIEIMQTLDNWNEVELTDGTKGWILGTSIEKVILN